MLFFNRSLFCDLLLAVAVAAASPPLRSLEVLEVVPHDPTAFTQCLMESPGGEGLLIEGTGLYGHSELRLVDPKEGRILRRVSLPPHHFGEGCTISKGELFSLTWREQVISVRDPLSFEERRRIPWSREGWGAAAYGDTLWISDGSDTLFLLSTAGVLLSKVAVRADGKSLKRLNELAEAGEWLIANLWQEDRLAVIDRHTGNVVEWWDAAPLRAMIPLDQRGEMEVLNGVSKASSGGWWLTGKRWPYLFRVSPKGSAIKEGR